MDSSKQDQRADGQKVSGKTKEKTDRLFQARPKTRLIMWYGQTDSSRQDQREQNGEVANEQSGLTCWDQGLCTTAPQSPHDSAPAAVPWSAWSASRSHEALSGLAGEENTNRTAVSKHWVLRIHCWLHALMRHCLGWLGKKTQTEQQLVNTGCSVFTVGFTLSWGTVWVGWGRKHKQNSS